ncbi:hypothetical protein [Sinosporangium album]|uniref:hypothetical protein n=1 Tax=Sinosporangium album TaxID=504805 RepID=UPI0015A2F1CF|nr:hypothetical protein [Sinosporangium album]
MRLDRRQRHEEAVRWYGKALDLVGTDAEREFLLSRCADVSPHAGADPGVGTGRPGA